jgi:DNA-directed RNA polymerase specialized sigma24 family protein
MDVEALYRSHAPALLAFLIARLPTREVAEDLHQTVWVRARRQPRELTGDHARRWLFTVA